MPIPYTKERLQAWVNESVSLREVLIKSERCPNGGGAYETLKRKLKEYDIDTSHFLGQRANSGTRHWGGPKEKWTLKQILQKDSPITQKVLRDYIKKYQVIPYECAICHNTGEWYGSTLILQLDHINGNNKDNRIENLRYLCPNCHSITDTFSGKNKGR